MKRRVLVLAWAAITVALCLRADLWSRPLAADNRLYFYMAERAAAGVVPHVSAPDVKNQLGTLVSAASIVVGRGVGLDDVRAGRIVSVAALVAGVCAVGLVIPELGGSAAAAGVAAVATLAFGALIDHTAIGFNPKIPMFALIAWTHLLIARGRFGFAGVAAAGALLCWQPAVAVCFSAIAAALVQAPRRRRILHLALGGIGAVTLYEAYFAWHGALLPQLFQAYLLPLGSVHDVVDLGEGLSFIAYCEERGLDRFGIPAAAFALFVVERCWWLCRRSTVGAGSETIVAPGAVPAVVALLVGGLLCVAFTVYDHQGEPDRFLLSVYFAIALGMLAERTLRWIETLGGWPQARRIEGALAVLLLIFATRTARPGEQGEGGLERQFERARIIRLYGEAYGSVWAFGCSHLLGLAHMTNYHPLGYIWDDLEVYLDADRFTPEVGGRLPDVILAGRRVPGRGFLQSEYSVVPVPALAEEHVRLYVRKDARVEAPGAKDDEGEIWREQARQPVVKRTGRGGRRRR